MAKHLTFWCFILTCHGSTLRNGSTALLWKVPPPAYHQQQVLHPCWMRVRAGGSGFCFPMSHTVFVSVPQKPHQRPPLQLLQGRNPGGQEEGMAIRPGKRKGDGRRALHSDAPCWVLSLLPLICSAIWRYGEGVSSSEGVRGEKNLTHCRQSLVTCALNSLALLGCVCLCGPPHASMSAELPGGKRCEHRQIGAQGKGRGPGGAVCCWPSAGQGRPGAGGRAGPGVCVEASVEPVWTPLVSLFHVNRPAQGLGLEPLPILSSSQLTHRWLREGSQVFTNASFQGHPSHCYFSIQTVMGLRPQTLFRFIEMTSNARGAMGFFLPIPFSHQ